MKVLVTGGGGFLGQAVCRLLAERGDHVSALNRRRHPALAGLGVVQHATDVRDPDGVRAAVAGCDAVVHCAALAGLWGPAGAYRSVNVRGTANVIDACLHAGVPRLVHTSSPSVVHDGRDLEGVDESAPHARRFLAPYPASKAVAERLVLAADGDRLATVALRPHLIWGPGDPHFLPHLAARARRGRLVLPHAPGKLIDTVYVDNAARAHLLALDALAPGSPPAGRAYFITQGEPLSLTHWVNALLDAAGLPPVTRHVPARLARLGAAAIEYGYRLARVRARPPLTRLAAVQATTSHWFDISAARRDLGYEPRISMADGLARLAAHLSANPVAP